jgi:hypothetical protein
MTARRIKTARRKPSHLRLVQTLPTRPSLPRRLLRMLPTMLPRTGIMIACSLALLAIGAIYAAWPSGSSNLHRSPQATLPASAAATSHDADTAHAQRARQLASTQQHVLMARVY